MLPMGHVAGTASAVIGTVSLAGGALIGSIIDRNLSSTVSPLVLGFAAMSTLALVWVVWAERGKLFTDTVATPATAGTDTSPTIPPVSGIAD
jgi:DHA1 family bicyclomycin/chloramphenicol resistance-like MFS transporter